MKLTVKTIFSIALVSLIFPSCVMKKNFTALETSKQELQSKYKKLQLSSSEQDRQFKNLNVKYNALSLDYKRMGALKEENENLSQKEKTMIESDLKKKMTELESSNKKIKDLEASLNAQKDAMNKLKSKIQDAFKVLNNENLTVERRGDKVYVSLPEDLLFKSGSSKVGTNGKDALKKFADVMATQQDIAIVVEGHTDSIPLNGSTIKDNWDLSVIRATSVVRILTQDYNLPATRITASGRGQYQPIASNTDAKGRAKNRRIEIVLVPEIVSLYELVE